MSAGSARGIAAPLLISLGVIGLALGAVSSVARRAIFFRDNFADKLAVSLEDPRVSSFVAQRITDGVLKEDPDLTAFRPLILGTTQAAVGSPPFQALMRAAARTAHASLFSETGRDVMVSVPDVGALLASVLANANPSLAQKIPSRVTGLVASVGGSGVDRVVLRLGRAARRSAWLTLALLLGGAISALAGLVLAPNPRQGLVRLGRHLVIAGIILFLLLPAGASVAALFPHTALGQDAARGLWHAFMGNLHVWALGFGASGLVLAAAGRSLIERVDPRESLRRLVARLDMPAATPRAELLRGALLLGVGTLVVLYPGAAASLVMLILGAILAFEGFRQIFQVVLRAFPEPEAAAGVGGMTVRVAAVLLLAVLFLAGLVVAGRQPPPAVEAVRDACNGMRELCDRRLDEVVFPATHNAMSSVDIADWLFPQQEASLPGQLEDGIRALLMDVHYGVPVEGHVKTDLDHETGSRAKFELAVGAEGLAAAMRIRDRFAGKEEGPRGAYLCHGFCELGATRFVKALAGVRQFLVAHPDEVIVLLLEDYVTLEDLAAAFAESGLDGLVYRGPVGPPWPTLREMIDSRQRVLVLIESDRTGVPWIHSGYQGLVQETPYHFTKPSELSCAANRGGDRGSLFLMNNWIDTTPAPRPSSAAIVNAYEALLARARQCRAERGRLPNLIAVDFYRTGGLFQVVRTLNSELGGGP